MPHARTGPAMLLCLPSCCIVLYASSHSLALRNHLAKEIIRKNQKSLKGNRFRDRFTRHWESGFKRADECLGICPACLANQQWEEALSWAVDGSGCGMNLHQPTFLKHTNSYMGMRHWSLNIWKEPCCSVHVKHGRCVHTSGDDSHCIDSFVQWLLCAGQDHSESRTFPRNTGITRIHPEWV